MRCHWESDKIRWGETECITSKFSKNESHITKQGGSFEKILSTVVNLQSDTNTIEDSTNSVFQVILDLYADTIKEAFFHFGVNISDFPGLKNHTVIVKISHIWGKNITEEGTITVAKEENR